MVEIESQSKIIGGQSLSKSMGQGEEKKDNTFIQCWKYKIISMHYFHPMVQIKKEIVKTNGPSWTICLPSPWKHQP
jgi:hypothetical protein